MGTSISEADQQDLAGQVMAGLQTTQIGHPTLFFPVIGSTNAMAQNMADAGYDEGLVILADEQTAGRGRHGRAWIAPPGSSVLMSVLLRPSLPVEQVNYLTMIVALAAVEAIETVAGLPAGLKWPNDLVIQDRKVGGVLTESTFIGDRLSYVVVGLGLNINFDPAQIPGIPPTATSLMVACGRPLDRVVLIRAILEGVERRYQALLAGHSSYSDWVCRLTTLGRRVRVKTPTAIVEGVAAEAGPEGHLIIRQEDGQCIQVTVGEVFMLRNDAPGS